jgi:hypothetical protein
MCVGTERPVNLLTEMRTWHVTNHSKITTHIITNHVSACLFDRYVVTSVPRQCIGVVVASELSNLNSCIGKREESE